MMPTGRDRRLSRLFSASTGRTIIVPIDDSLIAGPANGLDQLNSKLESIIECGRANAVLGFAGQLEHLVSPADVGWICNLTASTVRSHHTRKTQVGRPEHALAIGADAVAVHVNLTSRFESEMLAMLGSIVNDSRPLGVPVVAIMYPRRERPDGGDDNYEALRGTDEAHYAELVAHAARVARELGASVIKTQFTGSCESFRSVTAAAHPVPVVIAGGPIRPAREALAMADAAVAAGAAGVSFGRNVYGRTRPAAMLEALSLVVHDRRSLDDVLTTWADEADA